MLYDEPLLSYGPIFGKVHRMTPNDLDRFKVSLGSFGAFLMTYYIVNGKTYFETNENLDGGVKSLVSIENI